MLWTRPTTSFTPGRTGLERNADVVTMASSAPLFAHDEGWRWRPNLIWCDNLRSYGTPNYYVQQLFNRNRGDRVLPVRLGGVLPVEKEKPRFYATATRDEKAGEVILKVVNASSAPVETSIQLVGTSEPGRNVAATLLAGTLADENSFAAPRAIAPVTSSLRVPGARFDYSFKAYSLTVLRVPIRLARP